MKVEVEQEAVSFQPITLAITLENKDEAWQFWQRMNVGVKLLRKNPDEPDCPYDNNVSQALRCDTVSCLWRKLDKILRPEESEDEDE